MLGNGPTTRKKKSGKREKKKKRGTPLSTLRSRGRKTYPEDH